MKARRTITAASNRARASRRMMAAWADAQSPIAPRPTPETTDDERQMDLLDLLADRDQGADR